MPNFDPNSQTIPGGETIADLGENESLRRTISRLNVGSTDVVLVGPGDDAAVVASPDGRFVVTTDTMVEGHDFRLDWSSAYDLGFKAVASNLADVAAMGAKPTALVVSLVCPKTTAITWLESFADGLRDGCQQLSPGTAVVGGDLAASSQVVIAVTAHGDLQGREPVLRSGARVGDVLAVGATLGRAACGLALLQSGNTDAINSYDEWVNWQKRPTPQLALGVVAAEAGATSMLDLSDGLARDAARIAKASNVTVQIDSQQLQGFEAILEGAAQAVDANPLNWVLGGGEDHSLLATFPTAAQLPRGFKIIGRILQPEENHVLLDAAPLAEFGWDSVDD